MGEKNVDTLVAEVGQRIQAAVDEKTAGLATKEETAGLATKEELEAVKPTDAEIRQMVVDFLEGDDGADIVRKLKHDGGDDKLFGSKYGRLGMTIADIEFCHDVLVAAQASGRSQGPSEELRNAVNALSERIAVSPRAARVADELKLGEMRETGILDQEAYRRGMASLDQVYGRAMDTAETGFGLELIGAQYVSNLWTGAQARSRVFSLINQFDMEDPVAYLPVEAAVPEMLFVGESVDNNSAAYATSKTASQRVQVTAKKFVIHQMFSGEMEEDSIIPFVPFLQAQGARSVGLHSDSLVLNGDTTNAGTGNINLDDADPADTKHYLAFDGIRHAALVDNTGNSIDQAGPITYAALIGARGNLLDTARDHDWGHPDEAEDLIYVVDPETGDRICLLDEVISVDKFGDRATVLTGQQARVGLHPLISSIRMSKTEADGKLSTTGSNNIKGQVAVFNRTAFVVGLRRRLKLEVERLPASDQNRIVWSLRMGFGRYSPTGAASGIEAAAVIRNISL